MVEKNNNSAGRCPGPSTQDIQAADTHPAPPLLRESSTTSLGSADLSIDAYTSYAFHRREVDKVWRRCWQMAGREDTVREVGSYLVYDIVDDSVIVVRGADGKLRAFINSCLHRGTRLCQSEDEVRGETHAKLQQIRCPFHGFSWALDGALKTLPCAWDFPHIDAATFNLPEIKVDCWDGFVFVNFAEHTPSLQVSTLQVPTLQEYLGDLPQHFARWPLQRRYTAAHVAKRLHCNWKVVIEAFVETYHVSGVHPQSLPFLGDINSQYDVWPEQPHYSRMINPSGVASPHLANSSPQRLLDAAAEFGLCPPHVLQSDETARGFIVDNLRRVNEERLGIDLSAFSDAEVLDVIQYYVFPNLMPFGGFSSPLVYRVRPDGDDPQHAYFEVWLLLPFPQGEVAEGGTPPPAAPLRVLAEHENFADVEALSYFGPILDQDAALMPRLQRGLRSSAKGSVTLANYQEIRIRQMRQTLARYMSV